MISLSPGDRVRFSVSYLETYRTGPIQDARRKAKRGTVVGREKNPSVIVVRWDDRKTPESVAERFLDKEP